MLASTSPSEVAKDLAESDIVDFIRRTVTTEWLEQVLSERLEGNRAKPEDHVVEYVVNAETLACHVVLVGPRQSGDCGTWKTGCGWKYSKTSYLIVESPSVDTKTWCGSSACLGREKAGASSRALPILPQEPLVAPIEDKPEVINSESASSSCSEASSANEDAA